MNEKASTANDDLFFLDSDETRQEDTSFEEEKQLLERAIFVNNHLIEEGTPFIILKE